MKKKTGVILSSVAAIAVSASVIAGSTYALFTSESQVDISVSSANVEVSASVTGATLKRPTSINADTYEATYEEEGTALSDVSGKEISLDDIQPGDKITINLLIESESTVNFKYRVSLVKTGGDQNLYENLLVGIDGSYYSDYVSAWTDFSETTEVGKPITVKQSTVEILMPAYLGNEYKNLSCNVALKVEAVQGNVDKTAETGTEKKVYPVYSQDDLTTALAGVGEGETIVVMQKWNGVTINMSDATEAVEFGVKGCDVGTLTVNAPLASIHYDIGKTEVVEITAVANNSFHVSGEIAALNVSEGRVVFEEGAKVPTATFNVAADKSAKMEVLKGAEVGFIDDNNSAGTIVIDAVNGKVSEVANELLNNEKVTVTGYNLVNTEDELISAIANGGNIVLENDLLVRESLIIEESKVVVLNMNGYTVESMFAGITVENHGTLTITGNGILHNSSNEVGNNYSHDAIRNFGVLTIENGTFGDSDTDETNPNTEHRGAALRNMPGAVCTILNGNFTCGDNYYTWGSQTGFSYAIRNSGELTIENANLYGAMNGGIASEGEGITTINGGTFSVKGSKSYYVLVTSSSAKIVVNNGTFIKIGGNGGLLGGFSGMPSWDASENLEANGYTINGGTFTKDGETVELKK